MNRSRTLSTTHLGKGGQSMAETSVARITDISAKSTKSIEDAIHVGIARAQKTMYRKFKRHFRAATQPHASAPSLAAIAAAPARSGSEPQPGGARQSAAWTCCVGGVMAEPQGLSGARRGGTSDLSLCSPRPQRSQAHQQSRGGDVCRPSGRDGTNGRALLPRRLGAQHGVMARGRGSLADATGDAAAVRGEKRGFIFP